ncbi:hypothetical protein CASFOL_042674 [Castilleja foliolosa]|uniref:SOSEKI DIX-like domain-containing protein n=1 Tax=Castilleja foliolosa TaxID=1961234 RepID=A0ABD3B8K3_9LAMI
MELVQETATVRKICRDQDKGANNNKTCVQTKVNNVRHMATTFKKVDVVYYLCRNNGHLEHPHYIQVTHLAHQHLRLKDVMDRLIALRGKEMPSLYSWSCKRSYKNGYVWNDLAQNDAIYPSEGGEYVLKGSELVGFTEKLHQLQLDNAQQTQSKRNHLATKRQTDHQKMLKKQLYHPLEENAGEEEDEYEVKTRYNICSKGVSTDETEELKSQNPQKHTPNELNLDNNSFSPPSTTSSTHSDILSNTLTTITNNPNNNNNDNNNTTYNRLEDGDPAGNEPMLNRNSMLFSLIACGGSGSFRKTCLPPLPPPSTAAPARKSFAGGKEVICKAAAAEDDEMIKYMSENPRIFGNIQSEEKEYFSGSIVEAIGADEIGPALKKSSSFNQERSIKGGLGEETEKVKEVKKEKGMMKGMKCIPRKKLKSSPKK